MAKKQLVISGWAKLAKAWGGHGVHSEPEDGDEGGDAGQIVPGRELRFSELPLKEKQFDALLGEHAWRAFFDTSAGKLNERLFQSFSKVPLDDKYKNCVVEITFGVSASSVKFEPAAVRNLRIKFTKAGPELSGTFVGPRPRSIEMLDLEDFGGKPVQIGINFGAVVRAAEQGELGLQQPAGDGDKPNGKDKPADKTRIVDPKQKKSEEDTSRKLRDELRANEEKNGKSGSRSSAH